MGSCKTRGGRFKLRHNNRGAAERHALRHQGTTQVKVDVYKCPDCHYWHVGRHKTTKAEKFALNTTHKERVEEMLVGLHK